MANEYFGLIPVAEVILFNERNIGEQNKIEQSFTGKH